jgi:hypothetical protein
MSAELESLKNLVADALENRRVLGKLRASLRASVYSVLEERNGGPVYLETPESERLTGTPQGLLLAELVFNFIKYK